MKCFLPFCRWPFKLGIPALGLLGAGTAGFLNRTFRTALVLDRLTLSSYLGLMAISGISSVVWHGMVSNSVGHVFRRLLIRLLYFVQLVTGPILEDKGNQCPICLQVRAAGVQLANGLGYPLLLAPVVSYVVSSSSNK